MNLTKKQLMMAAGGVTAFIAIGIAIFMFMNSGPSAKSAWNAYTEALIKQDYDTMYTLLSKQAQEETDKETFVSKYSNIFNGIEASSIKIETKDIVDSEHGKAAVYHLSMNSIAGTIAFDQTMELIKEDDEYKLEWSYAQIFPQMQNQDGIRVTTQDFKRGRILDRNGIALAEDGEATTIGIVPGKLSGKDELQTLAKRLDISIDAINTALGASWVADDLFVPIKTISSDTSIKLDDLPGVMTQTSITRVYPYKEVCAHLTGYVQTINAEELEAHKGKGYDSNSIIGKTGLEQIYESQLRGEQGVMIQVIRNGSVQDTIASQDVKNGTDIKTTIDIKVQEKVYEQLKKDTGAGVVMNPSSGEVLALVSTPAYDPNDFSLGMSTARWNDLTKDEKKPLENRFIHLYTPGSTFKAVTAAAALDTKTITDREDLGQAVDKKWQKDSSWGNYYVKTTAAYPGTANLVNALIYSDNTYFAKATLKMGASTYAKQLNAYGFNEKMDFPFGINASSFGEESDLDKDITLADTGYGQGKLQISLIHLTALYASFENNGSIPKPYLLYNEGKKEVWKEHAISASTVDIMKKDLLASYAQFGENPANAGGKTGTAQVGEKEIGWLCSMNKQYAITLMVDNAEDKGGSLYVVPLMQHLWNALI